MEDPVPTGFWQEERADTWRCFDGVSGAQIHHDVSKYTGCWKVGAGVEVKGTAGVIQSGYIKQIRKFFEQLGAYIENNESQVGEQSCKYGEGMIYKEPWRWIGIWRYKYQLTLF